MCLVLPNRCIGAASYLSSSLYLIAAGQLLFMLSYYVVLALSGKVLLAYVPAALRGEHLVYSGALRNFGAAAGRFINTCAVAEFA